MDNKQSFEKYKRQQEEIDKIPKINPDFHFTIDDIAKRLLNSEVMMEDEMSNMDMVYSMTQELEPELLSVLDRDRSEGKISTLEYLIVSNYFLTASQNGPESSEIKHGMIEKNITVEDFEYLLNGVQMPPNIRQLLLSVYKKII